MLSNLAAYGCPLVGNATIPSPNVIEDLRNSTNNLIMTPGIHTSKKNIILLYNN